MKEITRRQFGKTVAGSAAIAGASLPQLTFGQTAGEGRHFPQGFVWGCATASYQIEGAANEGGRGPSIWDVFSHTPGKTLQRRYGRRGRRFLPPVQGRRQAAEESGRRAPTGCRSPGRVSFPQGTGQPNPAGLDYYKRVVDELLANGITPYVTLFHWDLPAGAAGRLAVARYGEGLCRLRRLRGAPASPIACTTS